MEGTWGSGVATSVVAVETILIVCLPRQPGMALSIARPIAGAQGGVRRACDNVGGGATFAFILPGERQ